MLPFASHSRSASSSSFVSSADTSASSVHAPDSSAFGPPRPAPMEAFPGLQGAQLWPSPVRPGGSTRAPSFRRRDSVSSVGSSSVGPHRTSRQSSIVGGSSDGPYAWSAGSRRTASSASLARSDSFSTGLERLGFDEPPSGDEEGLGDGDGEYEPDQPIDPSQAFPQPEPSGSAPDDGDLVTLAKTMRDTSSTTASDRVRQTLAIAWLKRNYGESIDGNVSRQALYASYSAACERLSVRPVNPAAFGRSVRSTFQVRTRRLGSRKASYYHYCGIVPLNAFETDFLASYQIGGSTGGRRDSNDDGSDEGEEGDGEGGPDFAPDQTMRGPPPPLHSSMPAFTHAEPPRLPASWPHLDPLALAAFPDGGQAAQLLWHRYSQHSLALLAAIDVLAIDRFELSLRGFFDKLNDLDRQLAQHSLLASLMLRADASIFDEILGRLSELMIVRKAELAASVFAQLRALSNGMEQVVVASLNGYDQSFVSPKVELAARFGHLVSRMLGLCQLGQALSAVLVNPSAVGSLLHSWTQIDWDGVRNQVALVVNCQHLVLDQIIEELGNVLETRPPSDMAPFEPLTHWLDSTLDRFAHAIAVASDGHAIDPASAARSFLTKASFVASQVMRDVTLRSDPSFGSFQILQTFALEWLALSALRKVSLHFTAVNASVDGMQPEPPTPEPLTAVPIPPPSAHGLGRGSYLALSPALHHGRQPSPLTGIDYHLPLMSPRAFANYAAVSPAPFDYAALRTPLGPAFLASPLAGSLPTPRPATVHGYRAPTGLVAPEETHEPGGQYATAADGGFGPIAFGRPPLKRGSISPQDV